MLPDIRVRQRDYLLEIAQSLTQELDLDKLLNRILKISIEMLAGNSGVIALRSEDRGWRIRVFHGFQKQYIKYLEKLLTQILPVSNNPEKYEFSEVNHIIKEITQTASMGLLSGVGLPLVVRENVIGVIYIFRNYPGIYSRNDKALLSSFADQAAIAVQNALLYTQIKEEKQRLDGLLDSTADGYLIIAPDHRIERANIAFASILQIPFDSIVGKYHDEVILWDKPPVGLTLQEAEAGGWPLTPNAHLYVEGDLKLYNNQLTIPVGITYSPLLSDEDNLINIIANIRDISNYRQAEELKNTFMSVISHELKTPVALIKGYTSTLRREDATWDREIIEDSLEVIEEEADRLTMLIENLLDATRLQAGGDSLKRSDISIPDLSSKLVERFSTQTDNHIISSDFPPNFPIILGDENRIRQVLSNLISNSIKYSTDGNIKISGQIRPNLVIICVSDEGPGISPDDIPHIFDRFYRAQNAVKRTKGAGLGLFLSKAIIEAHNGRIWVDTKLGQGTRICFSLPRTLQLHE